MPPGKPSRDAIRVYLGALEKGRAEAERQVANRLFQLCMKGNLGALIWWEKTRSGRHETRAEVFGADNPAALTIEQLLADHDARRSDADVLEAVQ